MYPGRHEHDGIPPTSLHCELLPQGDGTQGFITAGGTGCITGAAIRTFCITFQRGRLLFKFKLLISTQFIIFQNLGVYLKIFIVLYKINWSCFA
jgi:hypothetical protein